MNNDNLNLYFDALRNDGFLFSRDEALMVINNNEPIKSKISSTRAVILLAAFVVFFLLTSYVLWNIYHPDSARQGLKNSAAARISNLSTETLRSPNSTSPEMPDQNNFNAPLIKDQSPDNRHATPINPLQTKALNNKGLLPFISMSSDIPENKHSEIIPSSSNNSGDISSLIANSIIPQQKNYFAIYPPPLSANVADGDFRIPDMSNWKMFVGSNSCSSTENMKVKREASKNFEEESFNPIKLMICTPDEYAQLGIHATKSGIFIVIGSNFINCYNRHALYSNYVISGMVTAPLPDLVTDEDGTRIRSYTIDDHMINLIKDSVKKLSTIAEFDPIKVVMSTMNTLIPVFIQNDLDTSQGIHTSNIIAWYNPENMIFKSLISNDLKNKMLNGNYGRAAKSEKQPVDPGIWSDFKVYPNPACIEFKLAFKLTDNKILKINLFDIHGRIVKILKPERLEAKGDLNYEFNIGELNAGIYVLAVQSSTGEMWSQRIIKQ